MGDCWWEGQQKIKQISMDAKDDVTGVNRWSSS